jgi:hypothetical protein
MLAKSLTLIIILFCAASLNGEWRLFRRNYTQVCRPQVCTTFPKVIKPQNIQVNNIQNTPSVLKKPSVLSTPVSPNIPNLGRDYNETNNKEKDLQNQSNVVEPNKQLTELEQVVFDNDQFTPLRHETDVYQGHQTLMKKPSTVFEMVPFTKIAK